MAESARQALVCDPSRPGPGARAGRRDGEAGAAQVIRSGRGERRHAWGSSQWREDFHIRYSISAHVLCGATKANMARLWLPCHPLPVRPLARPASLGPRVAPLPRIAGMRPRRRPARSSPERDPCEPSVTRTATVQVRKELSRTRRREVWADDRCPFGPAAPPLSEPTTQRAWPPSGGRPLYGGIRTGRLRRGDRLRSARRSRRRDRQEVARDQARPADERSVHIRLRQDRLRIARLHRAPVEDAETTPRRP